MLQMDFLFFNVESIHGFNSTFVAICYTTSHPFGFPSIIKRPPLDIIKCIVATFRNQDKKVLLILFNSDGALERSSEFMKTCNNMNIIVQTTGRDASSLNGNSESPNNTLDNNTRYIIMKSSHKK